MTPPKPALPQRSRLNWTLGTMIYDALIGPFMDFEFMRRALVGTLALAFGATPVGLLLTLRRMSLIGDALAHAILPGAAIGFLIAGLSLFAMAGGGMIAGFIVAIGAGLIARATSLKEDASLAAFFLISLALGVTIVSTKGSNVDLMNFLFGSVLAIDNATLLLMVGISSVSLLVLALIWRPLVLESADPNFLRSVSRAGGPTHVAFLSLVVVNLIGGFLALGTLLAVGLMIVPAVTARFWARDMTAMLIVAVGAAALSGYAGLLLSYYANLPSGPAIVLVAGGLYALSLLCGPAGGLIWLALPKRHLQA
jgi:zinc/manganese transport system permease protein